MRETGAGASPAQGARSPAITATSWPAVVVVPPMPRGQQTWDGLPVDLLDGQSIPQGGRMAPDEAGCAIWPGITWLGVAGCGSVTVAVGNQLGFQ